MKRGEGNWGDSPLRGPVGFEEVYTCTCTKGGIIYNVYMHIHVQCIYHHSKHHCKHVTHVCVHNVHAYMYKCTYIPSSETTPGITYADQTSPSQKKNI